MIGSSHGWLTSCRAHSVGFPVRESAARGDAGAQDGERRQRQRNGCQALQLRRHVPPGWRRSAHTFDLDVVNRRLATIPHGACARIAPRKKKPPPLS